MTKLFRQFHIRRFGVNPNTGMIVFQKASGRVKELCEIPGPSVPTPELRRRSASLIGKPRPQLSGRRYDDDVIATTPDGHPVTTIQIENVFTDWQLLSTVCGVGTYEHVANTQELQVLQIARRMFGV